VIDKLRKILKDRGFVFEEVTDELTSIENFLTDDELEFLLEKINQASQADWEIEYMSNLKNFCMENLVEMM